jgi:PH/SEC7 domain-containing protein
VNSLGVESPSLNRSYSSSYSTPSTPVNRSISRVPLQPPTPVIVPPSPSTTSALSSPVMPSSVNWGGGGGGGSSAGSGLVSKNPTASPTIPSQDFPADSAEEAERQTNRRSMYRAPGTSSSPDLATLLRKAKERGGTGAPTVGALGRKDKRRDEPPPPLPGNPNVLRHGPVSYDAGECSRNVASSSPNKLRDGTVKVCLSRQ